MNNIQKRINELQQQLIQLNYAAWIAPSADPHQSEYVADHWQGRAWLSGFTGSAGTLIVTQTSAGLWTDSRYYLQAERQLQTSGITLFKAEMADIPSYEQWLAAHLPLQSKVAFDGRLLSVNQYRNLVKYLNEKQITTVYQQDLLTTLWQDRPPLPSQPAWILPIEFAGESRTSKVARVRAKMQQLNVESHIISTLDDIAWLLNLRGNDVAYNPVVLSYIFISLNQLVLFIQPTQLTPTLASELETDGIQMLPYTAIADFLQNLTPQSILIDPQRLNIFLYQAINSDCTVVEGQNIPITLKCVKNPVEMQGIYNAHQRDGVALVKWLYWLTQALKTETQTEITVATQLETFRRQNQYFQDLSFPSIVGYAGNGAIVHYCAEPHTAATLQPEGLLLIDSGAHYLDGTTDVTRTIPLGLPSVEQKYHFTLVLKGHIHLARARFPHGTTGLQLDVLARYFLWQAYLNYGHGTGHGVGHCLNVHEPPQSISTRFPAQGKPAELVAGMLTSNEPGLYLRDQYGIRIENLMFTQFSHKTEENTPFYHFEAVTLCPINLDLIELSLLDSQEKEWLNCYHQRVYTMLYPDLNEQERTWLAHQTRLI